MSLSSAGRWLDDERALVGTKRGATRLGLLLLKFYSDHLGRGGTDLIIEGDAGKESTAKPADLQARSHNVRFMTACFVA